MRHRSSREVSVGSRGRGEVKQVGMESGTSLVKTALPGRGPCSGGKLLDSRPASSPWTRGAGR